MLYSGVVNPKTVGANVSNEEKVGQNAESGLLDDGQTGIEVFEDVHKTSEKVAVDCVEARDLNRKKFSYTVCICSSRFVMVRTFENLHTFKNNVYLSGTLAWC